MRVRGELRGPAPLGHPDEVLVRITGRDYTEHYILHHTSVDSLGRVEIGYPVGRDGDWLLVELPSESMRGAWRVWVDKALVSGE